VGVVQKGQSAIRIYWLYLFLWTTCRKKTNLKSVKMGPDVTTGLKSGCHHFSSLYVEITKLGTVIKTARTMKDLKVSQDRIRTKQNETTHNTKLNA
jgi:hypothetical protein